MTAPRNGRHEWVVLVPFRMECAICGRVWRPDQFENQTGICRGGKRARQARRKVTR